MRETGAGGRRGPVELAAAGSPRSTHPIGGQPGVGAVATAYAGASEPPGATAAIDGSNRGQAVRGCCLATVRHRAVRVLLRARCNV